VLVPDYPSGGFSLILCKKRVAMVFFLALLTVSFVAGCESRSQRKTKNTFKLKVSDEVKDIPLSEILPKNTKGIGKHEKEISDSVRYDYMYGTLAGQYGNLAISEKSLKKALAREPDFVDARHNLGLVYYKKGLADKAVKEWVTTLRLDPKYSETYYDLGIFMLDSNRKKDAVTLMNRCIQLEPYHLKARFALGKMAQIDGKIQEAIRHFRAYQMKDKGDLRVHIALGELFLLANQADTSLKEFEAAARIDDKNPQVHYQLGAAYHRRQSIGQALFHYKRATELAPDHMDSFINIGDIYFSRQEYASALAAYNSALGVDSTNTYAKRKAAQAEQKLLEHKSGL